MSNWYKSSLNLSHFFFWFIFRPPRYSREHKKLYSFTNCGRLKQSDIKVIIPTFFSFRYPGYPREYKRVSLVTNCRLFFKSNIKVKISFNFLHDFLISHFNCCDWKFSESCLTKVLGKINFVYSSNKIRKAHYEHLNIVCQNLNSQ